MIGKGSARRPEDYQKYANGYTRVFEPKEPLKSDAEKHEECYRRPISRVIDPFEYTRLNYNLQQGGSSQVARQAHNLKVAGSNPAPAPN